MSLVPPRSRIVAIDLVRGVIMIIMALDHTRDWVGGVALGAPTKLATTTPALFFTRWITHFCAPTFCLLAGVAVRLSLARKSRGELARFLWTRGLWLIVLDAVVMRCLVMQWNVDFHFTIVTTLWMLGWCMIALAALIYLPPPALAILTVLALAGHNLLDGIKPEQLGALAPLWTFLHAPGFLIGNPDHAVFDAYPLIPWFAVMAAGYLLGAVYAWPAARRRTVLVCTGGAMIAGFVVLRWLNVYGDPAPWSSQATPIVTLLSFFNTTKQAPSLLFVLMTLGPVLVGLSLAEAAPRWLSPVVTIGKVPLFYFVLHFFVLHVVALVISAIRFGTVGNMFESPSIAQFPASFPPGWGLSLPWTYLTWLAVVLAVYPACRWFAGVKQRRRDWWLGYL
jgi:uncharacterized membrane protein